MPTWSTLLNESQKNTTNQNPNGGIDFLFSKKREYIKRLSEKTGRNTILYFSGFLQKSSIDASIGDLDINAFMENVHGLDKSKGLDLILHTPNQDSRK